MDGRRFVALVAVLCIGWSVHGGPFDWIHDNVKALDGSDDSHDFGDGRNGARDVIAAYYQEGGSELDFRIDLFDLNSGDESSYLNLYIVLDFAAGGQSWLPDFVDCQSELDWDYCIAVYDGSSCNVYDSTFTPQNGLFNSASFNSDLNLVEVSIDHPSGFSPGMTINFQVYTTKDGTDGGAGEIADHSDVCDAIVDDDHGWSDAVLNGWFTSNDNTGRAKVAFVQHGNQHIAYTDVFRGEYGNEENSGFDENLESHDDYEIPANLHISGTLMSGGAWNDMAFNDWVAQGVSEGRYEVLTSCYAQHIMPYFYDSLNVKSINLHKELCNYFYGYDPNVAWIPERVWKDTTVWGSRFEDVFLATYVDAVILDDDTHHDWFCGCGSPMHLHQLQNGLRVFFRNGWVSGEVLATPSPTGDLKRHWLNLALDSDQEQLSLYAMDWEITASVAGWGQQFPDAPQRYDSNLRYIGSHPWIQPCKLTDVLGWGWATTPIEIGDATYSALEAWTGNTHYDSWYNEWDAWVPFGCTKNSTQLWQEAFGAIDTAPDGLMQETAWFTLLANLYECGWQDVGSGMSGWMKEITAHLRHANVYAYAAEWVADPTKETEVFFLDVDNDGADEAVIRNDRLMAVFEATGGRAQWIFDYTGNVIVGNSMVRWAGTEGDYNDGDHIGALSDVSPYYINDSYDMAIDTPWVLVLSHDHITKRVSISEGDAYLDVTYANPYETTWIQTGFSPSVLDLLKSGQGDVERLWEPGYVGYRNNNTGVVGAYEWTSGVQFQKSETKTLSWMDEIYGGPGTFSFRVHAGPVPLSLVRAEYVDSVTVDAIFSKKVDPITSEDESNYSIDNGIGTPALASVQSDSFTVRLVCSSPFIPGITYELTVSGVEDTEGVPIVEDGSTNVARFGVSPFTFCVVDTLDAFYADGYRFKGSWSTSDPHFYDSQWGGGYLYTLYDDGTHGDDTPLDHIWKRTLNLVSDGGRADWMWGVTTTAGDWIDGNWVFTVSDGLPDTLEYVPPAGISQAVTVVFSVDMSDEPPSSYAGGVSVNGTGALDWNPGSTLMSDPGGDMIYEADVLFGAGSAPGVEFKFTRSTNGSSWEWETVSNREFTIDDSDTVHVLPTYKWDSANPIVYEFIRGDATSNGAVEMSDALYVLKWLYVPGTPQPDCSDSVDADDDGAHAMGDALYILRYLYVPGSPEPPEPFPDCGVDPSEDSLDCADHPCMD